MKIKPHDPDLNREIIRKGGEIRELRKARNWTQRDLAQESGVAQYAISRIENGRYKNVPYRDLVHLLRILGAGPLESSTVSTTETPFPIRYLRVPLEHGALSLTQGNGMETVTLQVETPTAQVRLEAYNAGVIALILEPRHA